MSDYGPFVGSLLTKFIPSTVLITELRSIVVDYAKAKPVRFYYHYSGPKGENENDIHLAETDTWVIRAPDMLRQLDTLAPVPFVSPAERSITIEVLEGLGSGNLTLGLIDSSYRDKDVAWWIYVGSPNRGLYVRRNGRETDASFQATFLNEPVDYWMPHLSGTRFTLTVHSIDHCLYIKSSDSLLNIRIDDVLLKQSIERGHNFYFQSTPLAVPCSLRICEQN